MASRVFFSDLTASYRDNLFRKLDRLLEAADLAGAAGGRRLTAVKLHFGEAGNTAFVRPVFVRRVVAAVRAAGGSPFLTDANTLYAGTRSDTPSHLTTAIQNGFAYAVVDAPLVIADGLRGKSEVAVPVDGRHFREVYVAAEIARADALVSVAHFKGHELAGFGGTIKNLGMGCASRRGKMAQHAGVAPRVKTKKCIGCGECAEHCASEAITLSDEAGGKAVIDPERCIGCGECIIVCPQEAVRIQWKLSVPEFMERMVEYTAGVLADKAQRCVYLNFVTDVSPGCDCLPFNDRALVRDIGILASRDPVAIDQAAVDLVNREPALAGCCLKTGTTAGADKFRALYPKVDWAHQLEYAEQRGLGHRTYDLETV